MQLYLIRHAQSVNNALYAAGAPEQARHLDPEITQLGRRQAERLAEYLGRTDPAAITATGDPQNRMGFGLTHLYTSLMVRAATTGMIVAKRLGLPLHAWVDWHEEGGLYLGTKGQRVGQPGPRRADLEREFPGLVLPETLGEDGWWNRPFEELSDRTERARRVLTRLVEEHGGTDHNVAVFTHGGFTIHFIGALLGLEPPYPLSYLVNNTGISRVSFISEGRYVVYQNRCEHLPAEMITY